MNYGIARKQTPLIPSEKRDENSYYARIALRTEGNEVIAIEAVCDHEPTAEDFAKLSASYVAKAKKILTKKVVEYDCSDAVNSFLVNGETTWLDKATRVGLMNSLTIEKEAGHETTTLYLNGAALVIPVAAALSIMSQLELYAIECYRVTEAHKAAVSVLSSIEDVENYDYKANYPERPSFTV